jgi:hypothetical protein
MRAGLVGNRIQNRIGKAAGPKWQFAKVFLDQGRLG